MSSSSANYGLLMRKRPGLMSNESAIHPQPLDLSIRRQKVRQHWSGGSIVEVNETQQMHPPISVHSSVSDRCYSHYAVKPSPSFDTTLFSFNSGTEEKAFHQLHLQIHIPLAPVFPTSATLTPPSPASSSLDYNNSPPHSDRIHHHHHHHHHSHVPPQDKSAKRSRISMLVSSVSSVAPVAAVPAVAPAAPAANPVVVDSDLQRLKHSQKHLRLSGYYYPHFSRKESVQLLQHTPVIQTHLLWPFVNDYLSFGPYGNRAHCAIFELPNDCLESWLIITEIGSFSCRLSAVKTDFNMFIGVNSLW